MCPLSPAIHVNFWTVQLHRKGQISEYKKTKLDWRVWTLFSVPSWGQTETSYNYSSGHQIGAKEQT